jgi:hypothetical protein
MVVKNKREEELMRTKSLLVVVIGLAILLTGFPAYGWEGRMGGMGDPFGLVEDESDFLIHPSKIAVGEGTKFYGDYRFNWRDVSDWDYSFQSIAPGGILIFNFPYKGSGNEFENKGLLGMTFPLETGRMGVFFQYAGKRGDFDGRENGAIGGGPLNNTYRLDSDLDSFALRVLYGLPVGGFKLGSEVQLAYRQEENSTSITAQIASGGPYTLAKNFPFGEGFVIFNAIPNSNNLFPFMIPYDSKFLEALLKGSLEGTIGPAKIAFTMRGGVIFGGDDRYAFSGIPVIGPGSPAGGDLNGSVRGWNIGGDLWLRYRLMEGLSLPFLVKIDYQDKKRNGDGQGTGAPLAPYGFGYENKEKNFQIEAGGGVDRELGKAMRVAAGIYYNYTKNKNNFTIDATPLGGPTFIYDYTDYPDHTEHQIILRLAGEKEISPTVAMRAGLNFFYGWVTKENFEFNQGAPGLSTIDDISMDGDRWGIGASLGATVKLNRFTVEPFLAGGYQKLRVSGDGSSTPPSILSPFSLEMDKLRKEWSLGGGFSVKF